MISFIRPFFDKDDLKAVSDVLQSGWVAQGPKVEEMERVVAAYLGCKHVISTTNCTTALTLALMALNIGPGDEVIVPDFTFPATVMAVTNVGATPVLVDVDMKTYNITAKKIEEAITTKTKAIIPVHLFGLACDMTEITLLTASNGLYIIEDAACSLGTLDSHWHMNAGTIGDIGCFSLHASKGINCGEGGLIATNDDVLADKMRKLSSFGDERAFRRSKSQAPFTFDPRAGNYKMSDITAAIVLSQLKKIDTLIAWRIKIAREWDQIISNDYFLSEIIISKPEIVTDHSHIYQSYVAVCKEGKRPLVMAYMKSKGFMCGIGTHAIHRYPSLLERNSNGGSKILSPIFNCLNSEYLYENVISFPRYYGLEVKKEWEKAKEE